MQKRDWFVFPVVVLAIIIFSGLLFYIVRGAADSQWYGFGVDSIGRVYIGKPMQIDVYQDGVFLSSIEIPKSRTYYFTVQEDDTILLSTSVDAYIFDFSGRELSCKPDKRCSIYNRLQWLREVETGNGEHFYFRESFGRRIIEDEEGEVLFQSQNYLASIASLMCTVFLAAAIFVASFRIYRLFKFDFA